MVIKPQRVVRIHRRLCEQAKCPLLDKINYNDPCVGCPEGHFGQYVSAGCEDVGHASRLPSGNRDGLPTTETSILKPGDLFGLVIFKITSQRTANCGICGQRKAQMNRWGWLGCLRPRNRKIIVGWICGEAAKRGHLIEEGSAFDLFKAAFRELRHKKDLQLVNDSERHTSA